MKPLTLDLPLRHVSIRVPWHDRGWAGSVFPLSSLVAYMRWPLAAAALAIMNGRADTTLFGPRIHTIEATLSSLFRSLRCSGGEEIVKRADAWPDHLREQVRMVMNDPDATHSWGSHERRVAWAVSEQRRRVNGGRIPKYSRL